MQSYLRTGDLSPYQMWIYTIMTKCIATQFKVVLAKMMKEHQFGYMKGRYIGDNIRSPLSVKNLAEDEISLVFYYPLTVDAISRNKNKKTTTTTKKNNKKTKKTKNQKKSLWKSKHLI